MPLPTNANAMGVMITRCNDRDTILVICKNEWTLQSEHGFTRRPFQSPGTTTVSPVQFHGLILGDNGIAPLKLVQTQTERILFHEVS